MRVKLPICQTCAAKLRAIRDERGEAAMIVSMGRTLCDECLAKIPGRPPGAPVRFETRR
jgi:hypothetical protein